MELTIEKLVYGGDGLGRLPEGEVLFVPWSAPGDRLTFSRVPGTAKPAKARIEKILSPGPDRVEPKCEAFGTCGGCQWQHVTPAAQREWKRLIVQESLQRIGKLPDVKVLDTIGSDDAAWHYRNRAQWEIEPEGEELIASTAYQLGYHATQSNQVVEFSQCQIIPETLNQVAFTLRAFLRESPELASALLRIEAFMNAQEEALLLLEGEKHPQLANLAGKLHQALPQIKGVCHRDSAFKHATPVSLWGQPFLLETLGGQTFKISCGSFFQTNRHAAERLLETLDAHLLLGSESLLDVYAGVGVFALHFKDRMQRVLAVENSRSAMADARENLALNQATDVQLKAGDARAVLRELKDSFDLAIIDPPRAGCQPEVLQWLSSNVKRQLLYVSCNPTTLARDLKALAAQGWFIQAVQPIDMFPQTYHVETVVSLIRQPE